MSFQLMAWASEQQTGSPSRKAVLLALANRANHDTGRCDPRISHIATETELSEPTVKRALADLEKGGFIARVRKRRGDGSLGTYSYSFPHQVSERSAPEITVIPRPEITMIPLNQEVLNQEENLEKNAAQSLVADYVDMVRSDGAEPPRQAVGMVAQRVKQLLNEGQSASVVRIALQLLHERRLHPSVLPTLIVEAAAGPGRRRTISDLDADYEKLRRGEAL